LGVQQYLVELDRYDNFVGAETARVNSDSDVLFSAGAIYELNSEIELFAGYSENFAAIKDLVLEKESSALTDIDPETAENIDFGLRYRGDDIDVSFTGYSISFDNRITFIAPGSDTGGIDYTVGTNGSYINVGGVESSGFEVSATYKYNLDWSFYASYTSNDSEYVGNAPGFKEGDKVIDSIDEMWVVSADYTNDKLRYGLSAKHTGERGIADAYTVVDMYLGYNIQSDGELFKSMDISLVVNNLLDESYLSTGTGNGTTYFIGAPKTAAVTFSASF
jgi:iron complex outermembrane receptor protein